MASPEDIVRNAMPGRSVVGWKIGSERRRALLERLGPRYENVVANHVTLAAEIAVETPLPGKRRAEIVGHVDDGKGVEAMVVSIDGRTDRPGGGTYHITWSLRPGREAKESNDVLAERAWQPLREPVSVDLEPARF